MAKGRTSTVRLSAPTGLWPVAAGLFAALWVGCADSDGGLSSLDERYTDLMVDQGVADRDTARNVRNKEARQRKAAAEKARVAFFRDPKVQAVIDAAHAAPEGTPERAKGDAYWRQMLIARSWTEAEKAEETRLLGRLEEAAAVEATWSTPDGTVTVPLHDSWSDVSKSAAGLPPELLTALSEEWAEQRMRVVGSDLQELVRLRNTVAQREGFQSYWELALAGQGLTVAEVEAVISELSVVIAPVHAAVGQQIATQAQALNLADNFANRPALRRAAGLERGREEADAYFDTDLAEDRIRTAYADMGLPTEGWQVYTGPTRYVRSGVYGFPVRPPQYVAIVMSQDNRWSVWQYEALAHEGGHAYWWQNLTDENAASPVLWEPPAPWFEGFAQFFERVVYDPGFSARYVPELPADQREALHHWRARRTAEWIANSMIDTLAERRLYEDPNNLTAITQFAAETRTRLTGEPMAPTTQDGRVADASLVSALLWNYPAYAQNFLFAYMTEAWLYEAVVKGVGDPVANPEVGPFLRTKLVRVAATTSFPDRMEAILPGQRSAALKRYLETPPAPTPVPAKTE